MRYIPPFGSVDPNEAYVNGNPAVGLTGFVPAAESVEHKLREIVALIRHSGYLPQGQVLEQATHAVRSQYLNFAVDTGTANALVVSYLPPLRSLPRGLPLHVLVAFDNTGPAMITVDGIGPIFILRATGANLGAGDLRAGEMADLIYDGTYFQLANFIGYSADNQTNNYYTLGIPYTEDISASPNLIQAPFDPAITSLAAGLTIEVKIANRNTAAASIIVNSLPAQAIRIPSGVTRAIQELEAGQLAEGMVALLVYDGQQFQLISPGKPQAATVMQAPVQIVKMRTYEDPNKHVVSIWPWGEFTQKEVGGHFAPLEQPVFEFEYVPVSAGNKLRVEVSGALAYVQPRVDPSPCVILYLSYAPDGTNYNPAAFPGLDYPTVGSFAANTGVLNFQRYPIIPTMNRDANRHNPNLAQIPNIPGAQRAPGVLDSANPHSLDVNFKILGQLTVPPGPPSKIKFRISLTAFPSYVPEAHIRDANDHIVHGGTICQLMELTR